MEQTKRFINFMRGKVANDDFGASPKAKAQSNNLNKFGFYKQNVRRKTA